MSGVARLANAEGKRLYDSWQSGKFVAMASSWLIRVGAVEFGMILGVRKRQVSEVLYSRVSCFEI